MLDVAIQPESLPPVKGYLPYLVTYSQVHGRGIQGACRAHPAKPARRALRARRAEAERARGAPADDALRRDEAPAGAGGGGPGQDPQARPREAALPQPRPDPARPRPLGEQVRAALDSGPERPQARPGEGGVTMEKVFEIYSKTT